MRLRNSRILAALLIGAVIAVLASSYLQGRHGIVPADFEIYLRSWALIGRGASPYSQHEFRTLIPSPGLLAMARLLPSDPERAWLIFGGACLALLAVTLASSERYQEFRRVIGLMLGFALGWQGILETLQRGQPELLILSLAVASAALFELAPVLSGFLLGFLPGIRLSCAILFVPFWIACRTAPRKNAHRFRRFLSGYLSAWLLWSCALPSLVFGRDAALRLSQEWVLLLRQVPVFFFGSELNQSLWSTALRQGLPPLVALGIACILAGAILGRLMMRTTESSLFRLPHDGALAWISPWLLFMQWVSPQGWRWGSAYAIGVPLAWQRVRHKERVAGGQGARSISSSISRMMVWTAGTWIFFLWFIQAQMHLFGAVSFYWVLLIGLCL